MIAIMDESDRQINFNNLKKSVISLSSAIGALDSPLEPHPESDLITDPYSDSTLIANMNRSGCQISFNSLNKSTISLSVVIGALGSPLEPFTDLYSGSIPIAIKMILIVGWLSLAGQYDEMDSSDFSDLYRSLNT
jgi:type III secretory pathway component EscS